LPHPSNLLGQLFPLTNLPRKQADLNAFFIPSIAAAPSSVSDSGSNKKSKPNPAAKKSKSKETESTPEWMAAYDSSDSEGEVIGGKRQRTSKLNIHAAIHSPTAHTSAYTDLYIAVLSRVALDEAWTRKILVGLHGTSGILDYLRPDKRVRVADWLGNLVDRGGVEGMLAVNGLFVMMTQYNLFVNALALDSLAC
jgi:U3 small nucleolar RNA-associated protein 19